MKFKLILALCLALIATAAFAAGSYTMTIKPTANTRTVVTVNYTAPGNKRSVIKGYLTQVSDDGAGNMTVNLQ